MTTSAHYEAIASILTNLHSQATGKWTKCQWAHKVGSLDMINLKDQTVVDIESYVVNAPNLCTYFIEQLAKEYSHEEVIHLAHAAEWRKHGLAAQDYLRKVEWHAQQAESLALELIVEMREGNTKGAADMAAMILTAESIRPSGKPVWSDFCHEVITIVSALDNDWEPRMIISGQLLGEEVNISREDQDLYTAAEWLTQLNVTQNADREWHIRLPDGQVFHRGQAVDRDTLVMEAI